MLGKHDDAGHCYFYLKCQKIPTWIDLFLDMLRNQAVEDQVHALGTAVVG